MPQDIAKDVLRKASDVCDEAEVFEEWGEVRSVEFEYNSLKQVKTRQFRGLGLRVVDSGQLGFSSSTDLRNPGAIIERARNSAEFGDKAAFDLPSLPSEVPNVQTADPAVSGVEPEDMVEMGQEALEMSRDANDGYLFEAQLSRKTHNRRVLNSTGLDTSYETTSMSALVGIEHFTDDGLLEVHEQKNWGRPFESATDLTEKILEKMDRGSTVVEARNEELPFIFTPKAASVILNPVLLAANGKLVQKGSSVLRGKLGQQVIDERISITDDASIDYAPASGPVDCEGVPATRTPIIEDGVLQNYLLDLQTAGLMETRTTGHGYRSYNGRPSPSSTNTILAAGEHDVGGMYAGLDRGIIVDQVLGSGQSNVLAGEFSVNIALGYLVEQGEIQGRVKDCMVAGNSYEVLSNVRAISEEREWQGSNLLPSICMGGMKLAARS